jgi:N-acetylmuramoyl-L-alanine amidase
MKEIHLTAPSEYYVWGAGKATNPYFYQIEVVRAYTQPLSDKNMD